jgi:hypothetical protein
MPPPAGTNPEKPGVLYRIGNIGFDLVTLGIFTARYKRGWPNAWTSDGKPYTAHKPHDTTGAQNSS